MFPTYKKEKLETIRSILEFSQGNEFPRWPVEVFLEVSNICDLQCAMCPTFSALNTHRYTALKREDRGVIAYETATEPMEDVLKHALIIHASGYGEPTIHPQYRELLTYLTRYEALIDFFTNGMHLDEDFCRFLVESHMHRVSISFSGATAEEYENIYIGGDYERVLSGIKRLSEAKKAMGSPYPRIEINSISFRHHIDKLPEFVRIMGDAGANIIHIKPLRVFHSTISELKDHESHMHPDREKIILEKAKKIAKDYGMHLASAPYEATEKHALNFTRAFDAMPDPERQALQERVLAERVPILNIKNIALSADKRQEKKQHLNENHPPPVRKPYSFKNMDFFKFNGQPCLEPFKTLHVSFDGRVKTCCFDGSNYYIGHLKQLSAKDIWNSAIYTKIRERVVKGFYLRSMCKKCLKKGSYPKQHDFRAKFNAYKKWYESVFQQDIFDGLEVDLSRVPPGNVIMEKLAHKRATLIRYSLRFRQWIYTKLLIKKSVTMN